MAAPSDSTLDAMFARDAALAESLAVSDVQLARDAAFAQALAAADAGLSDAVPAPPVPTLASVHARPASCPICLDFVSRAACHTTTTCGHLFCLTCLRAHIATTAARARFPVNCPSCRTPLDTRACLALVAGMNDAHQALQRLMLEREHHEHLYFCANAACAAPFDWVRPTEVPGSDAYRVRCPLCEMETCVKCKERWHEGMSCDEFRSDGEDGPLRRLARRNRWRACPRCGHVISRSAGCNSMRCRCGCTFCYNCGAERICRCG